MKRAPLRRSTPLRRAPAACGSTPLRRTPLRPGPSRTRARRRRRAGSGAGGAADAQRAKIIGGACVVCQKTKGITPAHLAPRALGGCDHPDCVVPMCWLHHRAYDTGRLDLLPHLEPRWRAEIAHAVGHLGLISAYRRLAPGRR